MKACTFVQKYEILTKKPLFGIHKASLYSSWVFCGVFAETPYFMSSYPVRKIILVIKY